MLKEQHIMPQSKEIHEQMRNKIVDMYQSGKGYKAISKAFHGQSHYPQMEKTWNSDEPSRSGRPTKLLQECNDDSSRRS